MGKLYQYWHHLTQEEQEKAWEWYNSLSINQQRDFIKKHFSNDCRFYSNGVVWDYEFMQNAANVFELWEKEGKPQPEVY